MYSLTIYPVINIVFNSNVLIKNIFSDKYSAGGKGWLTLQFFNFL